MCDPMSENWYKKISGAIYYFSAKSTLTNIWNITWKLHFIYCLYVFKAHTGESCIDNKQYIFHFVLFCIYFFSWKTRRTWLMERSSFNNTRQWMPADKWKCQNSQKLKKHTNLRNSQIDDKAKIWYKICVLYSNCSNTGNFVSIWDWQK